MVSFFLTNIAILRSQDTKIACNNNFIDDKNKQEDGDTYLRAYFIHIYTHETKI